MELLFVLTCHGLRPGRGRGLEMTCCIPSTCVPATVGLVPALAGTCCGARVLNADSLAGADSAHSLLLNTNIDLVNVVVLKCGFSLAIGNYQLQQARLSFDQSSALAGRVSCKAQSRPGVGSRAPATAGWSGEAGRHATARLAATGDVDPHHHHSSMP